MMDAVRIRDQGQRLFSLILLMALAEELGHAAHDGASGDRHHDDQLQPLAHSSHAARIAPRWQHDSNVLLNFRLKAQSPFLTVQLMAVKLRATPCSEKGASRSLRCLSSS